MSESRKKSWRNEAIAVASSLSVLPFWYPFFERSLYQRSQILQSKKPGDLSHSNFFNIKRNYYRGLSANVITMQPLFPAVEWILKALLEKITKINNRSPELAEKILAGHIAGWTTVLVANPYETTNIAAQQYRLSIVKAFLKILKESGPKGFYTGAIPMGIRNGSFVASLFVTTPELKKRLDSHVPATIPARELVTTTLAAVVPASLFTCMVIPFDIAAIMRQSDPSQKTFDSAFTAMKKAYQKHGAAALKAGTLFRLLACNIEMIGFNLFHSVYRSHFENSDDLQHKSNSMRK